MIDMGIFPFFKSEMANKTRPSCSARLFKGPSRIGGIMARRIVWNQYSGRFFRVWYIRRPLCTMNRCNLTPLSDARLLYISWHADVIRNHSFELG